LAGAAADMAKVRWERKTSSSAGVPAPAVSLSTDESAVPTVQVRLDGSWAAWPSAVLPMVTAVAAPGAGGAACVGGGEVALLGSEPGCAAALGRVRPAGYSVLWKGVSAKEKRAETTMYLLVKRPPGCSSLTGREWHETRRRGR